MKAGVSSLVRQFHVKRVASLRVDRISDQVAVEEPLEIRLQYWFKGAQQTESLALTMRTPGADRELAAGFLYSEGIIRSDRDIREMRALGGEQSNELLVELATEVDVEIWRLSRATFVNASCGICGKRSIEAVEGRSSIEADDGFAVDGSMIERLPELLREFQEGFAQTGGLHAAALIHPERGVEAAFEDVGRHNALDKVVGWSVLQKRIPLRGSILFLSSRSSFELIQKAAAAGAPIVATVGSPSSLAIEAARSYGLTLIGFVRERRFNIYSGDWRIRSQ